MIYLILCAVCEKEATPDRMCWILNLFYSVTSSLSLSFSLSALDAAIRGIFGFELWAGSRNCDIHFVNRRKILDDKKKCARIVHQSQHQYIYHLAQQPLLLSLIPKRTDEHWMPKHKKLISSTIPKDVLIQFINIFFFRSPFVPFIDIRLFVRRMFVSFTKSLSISLSELVSRNGFSCYGWIKYGFSFASVFLLCCNFQSILSVTTCFPLFATIITACHNHIQCKWYKHYVSLTNVRILLLCQWHNGLAWHTRFFGCRCCG